MKQPAKRGKKKYVWDTSRRGVRTTYKTTEADCAYCKNHFELSVRQKCGAQYLGKTRFFCTRSCAAMNAVLIRRKKLKLTPLQPNRLAHSRVHQAVVAGTIKKPTRCEKCGKNPGKDRAGKPKIQGHHHDGYDDALKIQWLCVRCHIFETPHPRGEDIPTSKLKNGDVRKIRKLIAAGEPISRIARRYSVNPWTIKNIQLGKIWRHVQ